MSIGCYRVPTVFAERQPDLSVKIYGDRKGVEEGCGKGLGPASSAERGGEWKCQKGASRGAKY